MFQNVIEQLSGSKILRIAAHDFILVLGSIWQIDKVMQYIKQAFLSEQSAHHREHSIKSTIKNRIRSFHLMPSVKELIGCKK